MDAFFTIERNKRLYIYQVLKKEFDPYTILLVSNSDSQETIRNHYKDLILRFHPDKNSDNNTQQVFDNIQKAYDILSNKDELSKYHTTKFTEVLVEMKQKYPIAGNLFCVGVIGVVGSICIGAKLLEGAKIVLGIPYYSYCYMASFYTQLTSTPKVTSDHNAMLEID